MKNLFAFAMIALAMSGCVGIRSGGPSFRAVVWEDRRIEWSTSDQILVVVTCIESSSAQGVFIGQQLMCIAPHDIAVGDTLLVVRNIFTNDVAQYFGVQDGKYVIKTGRDGSEYDDSGFTPYYKKP